MIRPTNSSSERAAAQTEHKSQLQQIQQVQQVSSSGCRQ
jgi:hypothetical protein